MVVASAEPPESLVPPTEPTEHPDAIAANAVAATNGRINRRFRTESTLTSL
jgi:hypothetical protein